MLNAHELNFVAHLIELFLDFRKSVAPETFHLEIDNIHIFTKTYLRPLRQFIDQSGVIHFDKHPQLSEAQKRIQELDQKLRERIQQIIREEPFTTVIQFNQFDIINDRFVLPIRSDSYQHHLGAIIAKSQSGMTLFVEPLELRELSNQRLQALAKRDDILNKVFIGFSLICEQNYHLISRCLDYSLQIDLYLNKALFCERKKLAQPTLSHDLSCEVFGFFHPLISNPIANNLSLNDDEKGIIISGPNTGGKTVTLKSLCLCHIFMNMGLFVPAQKATLPLIKSLYYFSHDQQDLVQGLSSFSSEAKNYLELLASISDHSYIFIDEIFNSTSSEEASALAIGLLNELHFQSKAKVFLSTHHQLLKTFMHSNQDYLSCHVGYDFQNDVPTYKIIEGTPGSSLALSIFKKLSKQTIGHNRIVEKASSIMETKQVSYEALLEELTHKKTLLDKDLLQAKKLKFDLQNQKKASEGILFLEREKVKSEYKKQFESLLKKATNWFEETQSSPEINKKGFFKELDHLKHLGRQDLNRDKNQETLSDADGQPISENLITEGSKLFCSVTNSEVEIVNCNSKKKKAQVRKGVLNIWVDFSQLYPSKHRKSQPTQQVKVHVFKTNKGVLEIDCRGYRLDDFERKVLSHLEELLGGEIPYLTVVHGHGDGVLKSWLRQHLKSRIDDFEWSSPDGNDGSTIIKLST